MRDNPSITYASQRHVQMNQPLLATSRSSWFPPFVGTLITLYAMIDSAVEGTNIPLFALLLIGISLICYRLWPASAKARLGFLWWEFLISVGCLVAQVLPFVISNETLTVWVGDKSIGGLVLDSIALLLLFWLSSNKLFASLHGPSKLKFWRAPMGLQIAVHITCISFASMFNPSILLFPFFIVLLFSLYRISSGSPPTRILIGKEAFPSIALGYLVTCIIGGYILCLPVIRDHVNSSTDWLPELLGIPRIGSDDSTRNFSCVMPSLISLLLMFVMLPWWCHVKQKPHPVPLAPSRSDSRRQTALFTHPERQSSIRQRGTLDGSSPDRNILQKRTLSRGLSVVGEHVVNDENDHIFNANSSPIMTSDVSPNFATYVDIEDVEEKEKNRDEIFRLIRSVFGNFFLPIGFILSGLLLPSSLSIPLVVIGCCMIVLSSRLIVSRFRPLVQSYMSVFVAGIFVVGFLWQVCPDSTTFVLSGIGVMNRDRNIWTRFVSIMSLLLLIISWSLISRFWATEPPLPPPSQDEEEQVDRLAQVIQTLKQSNNETEFNELMRQTHLAADQDTVLTSEAFKYLVFGSVVDYTNLRRLLLVDAVNRSTSNDKSQRRRNLVFESFVGILRSCEMSVSLILVVLISTCAILNGQSPFIFVLYAALALMLLWLPNHRKKIELGLAIISVIVIGLLIGYASWSSDDAYPSWMSDLGIPQPTISSCFVNSLPHLLILSIVSIDLRTESICTVHAKSLVARIFISYPRLVTRTAVLVPLILALVLFGTMPFDYFSAFVLLCFVIQMGFLLEASDFAYTLILRISIVQVIMMMITVIWVFVSMIPLVNHTVIQGLSDSGSYLLPSEIAVMPHGEYLGKLAIVSSVLVTSSFAISRAKYIEGPLETTTPSLPSKWTQSSGVRKFLIYTCDQFPRALMFIIFLASIYRTNLLNEVSEFIVCLFLVVARGWRMVGAVFSVVSMVLLLLQYLASFAIINLHISWDVLDYVGLVWTNTAVARNIVIFLACILQRNYQQFIRVTYGPEAVQDTYYEHLNKYASVWIAIGLAFASVGRSNFYSLIYIILALVFIARVFLAKESSLSPLVLRIIAIILWVSITVQLGLRLWFPTVCDWCKARPSVGWICPENLSVTQRAACIDDWQRWFNVPTSKNGNTELIDHPGYANSIAESLGIVGSSYSVPQIEGVLVLWDFFVLWLICVCLQNTRLRSTAITPNASRAVSETVSGLSHRSRHVKIADSTFRVFARAWIVVVEILAVLSCFTFRHTVDVFSIVFIGLTVWTIWSQEKLLPSRKKPIITNIVVCVILVLLTLVYQIPGFPCKFWYSTCESEAGSWPPSLERYSVPDIMCVAIQSGNEGCENFGAFSWTQVVIQIISLVKINVDVSLTPFPMGLGPPLLLLAACLVQLAMYNYSTSYAEIDEEVFTREISVLRIMRSRRLIVEMNAQLLLKNRQVKLGLEASKRKLLRVQESADELLKVFYARLAEINGPPALIRQISDGSPAIAPMAPFYNTAGSHLSSEYESLCSRGYSEDEARAVLSLIDEQDPEEMAVRILEFVHKFGLGDVQESDVYLECRKILGSSGSSNIKTPTPIPSPSHSIGIEYKPVPWYKKGYKKFREFIASRIDDVAFLSDENAAEPLCLHRRSNGLLTLIIKAIYSNSIIFVCLFILLAFVEYNAVFDLVRILILLLLLPSWPFPSKATWMLLVAYTIIGLILRAIYQLPIFCGDANPVWRFQQSADLVPPCPAAVGIGWDLIIGLQKKFGSSAIPSLTTTGLAAAVWPDLLILAALFTYRSYLCKCGIWDHLEKGIPERDAGAFIVPIEEHRIQIFRENLRRAHENDPLSIDEEMLDDEDLEPVDVSEEEGDDATPNLGGDESPIGSFIDINYRPLTLDDRSTLSRYAVQRHMSNEDVFDRLMFSNLYRHRALARVIQIYKDLRWDAQIHYSNHQCVRISRQERELKNLSAKRSRQNLSFLSSLYVRINPFYAIKVGVDYYAYLCLLGMMMFFHIVFFYSFMTGNSSDFLTSLKKSQLSGGLALLMFFQFVLIVVDRAYYIASFRRGGEQHSRLRGGHKVNAPSKQQVLWFFLRVLILLALFCALHAVIIVFLFTQHTSNASVTKAETYEPLIANAALSIYYLEFMLYLLVSVFQIKEGFPRVMRETLRPEKTYHIATDRFQEWRFLVYRAIPFLDELRILIDWTCTRTSLDLFQYFKLEDAHTYLWQTKREMELRKEMWPAEQRTRVEKIVQGFGFLLLLMVIIIGPVLLFSTLIAPQTVAPLTTASLSMSITFTTCAGESIGCAKYASDLDILESSVPIYTATSPLDIRSLSPSESDEYFPNGRTSVDKLTTVQQVSFSSRSDTVGYYTDRILELFVLLPSAVMIEYQAVLSFYRASSDYSYISGRTDIRMPACACAVGFEQLCDHCVFKDQIESSENFAALQDSVSTLISLAPLDEGVVFPGIFESVIQLDSSGNVVSTSFGNQTAAVMYNSTSGFGRLSTWDNNCAIPIGSPGAVCSNVTESSIDAFGSDTTFTFLLPPVYASNTTSGALLSIGIVTVYITIVYAIGKFIRLVFDKESLRVIYLEIPRPDDFLDLAKGAQTARQYKDLPMEFRLYNCLIKVLRSPETLIALGGAEITGYGVGRTDDPPHPDMLTEQEQRSRIRRRRADAYYYQ